MIPNAKHHHAKYYPWCVDVYETPSQSHPFLLVAWKSYSGATTLSRPFISMDDLESAISIWFSSFKDQFKLDKFLETTFSMSDGGTTLATNNTGE
jgi:hypothetical protein